MNEIPENIDVEKLPGPKRGTFPALYFQDEIIYSPNSKHFALAYTITEASMGNDIGCIAWGSMQGTEGHVIENPAKFHASCWQSPWCKWISEEAFVFKAQKYAGNSVHVPLVVIDLAKGYCVLPGSNEPDLWLPERLPESLSFKKYNERKLLEQVSNA